MNGERPVDRGIRRGARGFLCGEAKGRGTVTRDPDAKKGAVQMNRARQWQLGVLVAVFTGTLTGLGSGCKHQPPEAKTPPKVDARLVSANTAFGFKLLQKLVAEKPKENVFISPVSISLALAMTYNGAAGDTKAAMAKTMGVQGLSDDECYRANAALVSELHKPAQTVDLSIASSLWVDQRFPVRQEFLTANSGSHSTQVANLDFATPNAAQAINGWVSENTRGKIATMVTSHDLRDEAKLVLLNTAYFKAPWTRRFDASETREAEFTLPDGGHKTVQMMSLDKELPYLKGSKFQAVQLDCGAGRFAMLVLLPDEGSDLGALIASFGADQWQALLTGLKSETGLLELPRFQVEGDFGLKQSLSALGLGVAFAQDADFSGITSHQPMYLSLARHRSSLTVNEEGVEAGAATILGGPPGMPRPAFRMIVDRPFLCAITDSATGTILFLGAIVDPKA